MSESFNPSDEFDLFQSSKAELTTRALDSVYVVADSGEVFDRSESRYTFRFRNTEEYKRLLNSRLEVTVKLTGVTVGVGSYNTIRWENEAWGLFKSVERRIFNSQVEVVNNPRMVAQANKILNANPDHVSKISELTGFRVSTAVADLPVLASATDSKTFILYLKDVLSSIDNKILMGETGEISLIPEDSFRRVFLDSTTNMAGVAFFIQSMRLIYDRVEPLPAIADSYRKQLSQPYPMKFVNGTHFKSNQIPAGTENYVWNLMTTDNSISKVVLFVTDAKADSQSNFSASRMKATDAIKSIRLIFDEVQLPSIPYNLEAGNGGMRRAYLDMLDQSGKELSSPDSEPLLSYTEYNDNYQLIVFDLSHIDQTLFQSNTSHQIRIEYERSATTEICHLNAIVYSHREVEVDTQRQIVRSIIGRVD